ncbi:ATP-binding protein [Desulfohalobium retbaense]|uniref:histidine kinase n=1 Tax=Desulfohalobium retbaense (strain ATCC 49708 / DSM 5692 / JCM 16813 / HR100) TaxID=485915 RepID=C8X0E0_DESRD|nr:ATP-binding protein [Desulfohalobium retbaense]ACV67765.1 PAS/PAC sensor signal transduction histidine kinase [Desulfohalobium retbaense DSM 5692]
MSLRTKLLSVLLGLLFLASFVPLFLSKQVLHEELLAAAKREAVLKLGHMQWLMRKGLAQEGPAGLNEQFRQIGKQLDVRITYIRQDGTVLADSSLPLRKVRQLENHKQRPEVQEAMQRRFGSSLRYSETLKTDLLYVARTMEATSEIPEGFIRMAVHLSAVDKRLDGLFQQYLILFVIGLAVCAVVSFWLASRVSRAMLRMGQTADAIGNGEYDKRIAFTPAREFLPLAQAINRMARRIQSHITTISDQNRQFESILNGMHEGVMVLDRQGKVSMVNTELKNILEVTSPVGRAPIELIRSPELQGACEAMVAATVGKQSMEPAQLQVETMQERIYDVNLLPLPAESQDISAIVVFHDITELKRLERVRRDFVANVSHELRTPLTSIKGYAETLLDMGQVETEAVHAYMQVVVKNANAMSRLLEDLLQLSKLESNAGDRELGPVLLTNAIQAAWKYCQPMAEEHHVSLNQSQIPAGVCVWSEYDPLVQVLRNLFENAIKFSPENTEVRIEAEQDGPIWQISVVDSGPGVGQREQERIFERFYRVQHGSKQVAGTGLGLAIARHIVRNHVGRIWVESPVPGQIEGSAFRFTLRECSSA